jgi:archaemetzincin
VSLPAWRIELVRIGALPPALAKDLSDQLVRTQPFPVRLADAMLEPSPAFDSVRQQYLATGLLEMLTHPPPQTGVKRIGLTHVDLFLPVFTHLFGYAQLSGSAGVVSTYRLRPESVTAEEGHLLLQDRLLKEVLHEMGHTFGLVHCPAPWCVMKSSRFPEELDLKDHTFCEPCLHQILVH